MRLIEVLKNQGFTKAEALKRIDIMQEEFNSCMMAGNIDEAERVLTSRGIEIDYIMDLI